VVRAYIDAAWLEVLAFDPATGKGSIAQKSRSFTFLQRDGRTFTIGPTPPPVDPPLSKPN
jgi:hypothetical protein